MLNTSMKLKGIPQYL